MVFSKAVLSTTLILNLIFFAISTKARERVSIVRSLSSNIVVPQNVNDEIVFNFTGIQRKKYDKIKNIEDHFKVYVGSRKNWKDVNHLAPITGTYKIEENSISFKPLFDFIENQKYFIKTSFSASPQFLDFEINSKFPFITPVVTSIFPSGDSIPENTLRFYIHFSTPMKPHVAYNYIKLVNDKGVVDDAAFMKFKQELWSRDRKRLTVLIDPGRIKRNVSTNLELGPVLKEGRKYKLLVEKGWTSFSGVKMKESIIKSFSVSSALRNIPNIDNWITNVPQINTKKPLQIKLDRPFDYYNISSLVSVTSKSGKIINGIITIKKSEKEIQFTPKSQWSDGFIKLVVNTKLEDVAGNNFQELLDRSKKIQPKDISIITKTIKLK